MPTKEIGKATSRIVNSVLLSPPTTIVIPPVPAYEAELNRPIINTMQVKMLARNRAIRSNKKVLIATPWMRTVQLQGLEC